MRIFFIVLALVVAIQPAHAETTLRIGTWNFSALHSEPGQSVPGSGVVRDRRDYQYLRQYAQQMNASIVALQSVNSIDAVHQVFPASRYEAVISERSTEDAENCANDGLCISDGLYTAFAIRKGVSYRRLDDVEALAVLHQDRDTGLYRTVRRGVEIEVTVGDTAFRVLSLHLKSGCTSGNLSEPDRANCKTLSKQIVPLDRWINAREREQIPFVIAGAFNRAFGLQGESDVMWSSIDDKEPDGAELWRYPYYRTSICWKGAEPPATYIEQPLDFLVFDNRLNDYLTPETFRWVQFNNALADRYETISPHCPLYVDLVF